MMYDFHQIPSFSQVPPSTNPSSFGTDKLGSSSVHSVDTLVQSINFHGRLTLAASQVVARIVRSRRGPSKQKSSQTTWQDTRMKSFVYSGQTLLPLAEERTRLYGCMLPESLFADEQINGSSSSLHLLNKQE